MNHINRLLSFFILMLISTGLSSQELPPGWDYYATLSQHVIAVPLASQPNINGYPLVPGDYIGVFYTNDSGELACGGAYPWLGDQNIGIIAFGNDSFTSEKDGFASGETMTYKFYSWALQKEYLAEVICDDSQPALCDVFASNGLSKVDSIWANAFYFVANASTDSLCLGNEVQLWAEASGGTGSYTYNWTSDPPGLNATIPNPVHIPTDSTTYFCTVTNNSESLETQLYVKVFPPPFADAGADATICEDESIILNGQHATDAGFYWSSSGDGSFDDPNIINPEYIPGASDILAGEVQLSLTVIPIEPCTLPITAAMQLNIHSYPEVIAGSDQTACEDDIVSLDASVLNTNQMEWSTSGDGTFSASNLPATLYYPGNNDIQSGTVEITITALALSPCQGQFSDDLQLSFQYLPEIDAGSNQLVCEDELVQLNATSQNSTSLLWQSSGDGTFADPALAETTYFPGLQDITDGEVALLVTAQPVQPCSSAVSDVIEVLINKNPLVVAGNDATICQTATMQLDGSAQHYDEVLWSSSGDGVFANPGELATSYTPGTGDIANGQLTLSLTAFPVFPCSMQEVDDLVLSIEYLPTANSGEDATIPYDENHQLQGEAQNYSLIIWSTDGDGFFDAFDILDPVYNTGIQDIANAGVQLALTAFPMSACLVSASDSMYLTIDTVIGIQNRQAEWQPKIYPNPTKSNLFVEIPTVSRNHSHIIIYDDFGRKVYEWSGSMGNAVLQESLQIDMTVFEPGIYFVQVRINDEVFYKKILNVR